MPLISHRGAAGLATANSSEAIKLGDTYKPAYIEVDINLTEDNIPVIFHGSMLKFLRGKRLSTKYNELKKRYPEILTLQELLNIKIKSPYMFDIKVSAEDHLASIYQILKDYQRKDFAFTSPHPSALHFMNQKFPYSPTYQNQPYHHGPVRALELARHYNFSGIAINKWWMSPVVYLLCKSHSKSIMCYTVDSKIAIYIISKLFPTVLLVTNRPDIYSSVN